MQNAHAKLVAPRAGRRRSGCGDVALARASQWLVRTALGDSKVPVRTSSPRGRLQLRLVAREIACLAALPYQLLRVRSLRGEESSLRTSSSH
jgi:hypothetical protein